MRRYRQEEGIDFKESFAPVARMEAIRIFLAYDGTQMFTDVSNGVKTKKFAFLHLSNKDSGIELTGVSDAGLLRDVRHLRVIPVELNSYGEKVG
ncbi:hypothetical protein Tco_0801671 [Tanacetum coccineum]|uniref:Reverse transcriptase Ty1/copia-type domain-containing protein n=1 Tax=Tanacetum coccineum TaxID=301880 RepID=A0ABQ5A0X1_9ASTR